MRDYTCYISTPSSCQSAAVLPNRLRRRNRGAPITAGTHPVKRFFEALCKRIQKITDNSFVLDTMLGVRLFSGENGAYPPTKRGSIHRPASGSEEP